MVALATTPRSTVLRDGNAALYRFASSGTWTRGQAPCPPPVLLVPSLINRWYVLDLREGASLARALVDGGLDVFCLDWGVPEDEDRHLSWDDVVARLGRAVKKVLRETGAERVSLLGYCMGGTLAGIYTALHPEHVAALVDLAGPFDFAHAGMLGTMTDARWFDAAAVAAAGNVHPLQMQAGFVALRPTLQIAKWVGWLDRAATNAEARDAFAALETWSSDNIPFPAAAYATYVGELYQRNALVRGEHHVLGRRVDLGAITCPLLTIATESDTICPLPAARALGEHAGTDPAHRKLLVVPGGHVGAVVGSRAARVLYPAIRDFFLETGDPKTWS